MKKRAVITHLSKGLPILDIPVYGSLTQSNMPSDQQLVIVFLMTFLKAAVIIIDYGGSRNARS